tara:strand:+ start:2756 stop:5131 length:2376 start_codon:yes stop_codon:yes gene_type:complete
MPFTKISPEAGLVTDGTRYSAKGGWFDSDKVRFRKGFAEKIGGWARYVTTRYVGISRKIHDWVTDSGNAYIGVGTTNNLYVNQGSIYHDITPLRSSVTLGTNPIATVDETAVVTISHTSHGAVVGDYVTIASATATGGIGTGSLNTEHRIVSLGAPDGSNPDDKYRIVCNAQATSTVSAGGGTSATAAYQINVGLDDYVRAAGWSSGTWGAGTWGSASGIGQASQLRLWSIDNFGDDMLACVRQGNVFYWDESDGTSTRAVALSDRTRRTITLAGSTPIAVTNTSSIITVTDKGGHGAGVGDKVTFSGAAAVGGVLAASINKEHTIASTPTTTTFTVDTGDAASSTTTGGGSSVVATYKAGVHYTPIAALQVMMSDVARHVICFGCNPIGSSTLNPLFVRWSTSENAAQWQPLSTNSAGGQELSSGSEIIGALMTRQEILIFTDVGIQAMRYSGSPFYFTFSEVAKGMSMVSPNAAVNANGRVFFMDRGSFYTYTGTAQKLSCPILSTVFDNFDEEQAFKVTSGSNPDFGEVIWMYPSKSGNGENDRYVIYNYESDVWYYGTLDRGAWNRAGTKVYPLASSILNQELSDNPITTTTDATSNVSVAATDHGLIVGDTFQLTGASATGGLEALLLNNEHTVVSVTDDTIVFTIADTATAETAGGGTVTLIKSNVLYSHENGHDDDGSAMTAYIETGDMDLGEGDQVWAINRVIPDLVFRDAQSDDEVTIILNGHNFPGDAQSSLTSAAVTSSTGQAFVRARARQVSMKVQSTGAGYGWRLGYVRLDGRTDGRR